MKIAVTGSSGYIGDSFTKLARSNHHKLVHLTRCMPGNGEQWQRFEIGSRETIVLPQDVDVLVHLAFNPKMKTEADGLSEIESANCLIKAAQSVGARVIFVSSQTAHINAPSLYGRIKWAIERVVLEANGVVVRPGQVYGGQEKGLFGLMVDVVTRTPVLPAFLPTPLIQPVHVDDLSVALLRVSETQGSAGRIFNVAEPKPLGFTEFLKCIATNRVRVRRLYFPVPVLLITAAVKLLGNRQIQLVRLQSLFELPQMETEQSLHSLQLKLRTLREGMRTIGTTEFCLQREARALLLYVLNAEPNVSLVNRYIDAIKECRSGCPMDLPGFALKHPACLALFDDTKFLASGQGVELAWRLDAATLLAEATTFGARCFLGVNSPAGFIRYAGSLAQVVCMEIFWRLARLISGPIFLRRVMKKSFQ